MANDFKTAIEQRWKERAVAQGLKPKSMAYKRAEIEFFTGAMTAIHATDPDAEPNKLSPRVPIIWVLNIMSVRPVVE